MTASPSVPEGVVLSDFELSQMELLTSAGVASVRITQKGFRDAQLGGFLGERIVFASVHPIDESLELAPAQEVGVVAGVDVEYYVFEGQGVWIRFECAGSRYFLVSFEPEGALNDALYFVPDSGDAASASDFAARVIEAAGCAGGS